MSKHRYKDFEKDVVEEIPTDVEYYVRMVRLDRASTEGYWDAYQVKGIAVQNGRVVKELFLDKPDTKQMVTAKIELMLNPDGSEIPDELKID